MMIADWISVNYLSLSIMALCVAVALLTLLVYRTGRELDAIKRRHAERPIKISFHPPVVVKADEAYEFGVDFDLGDEAPFSIDEDNND
jgi:hypothetical protein